MRAPRQRTPARPRLLDHMKFGNAGFRLAISLCQNKKPTAMRVDFIWIGKILWFMLGICGRSHMRHNHMTRTTLP
jgi:hypothetical protein